MYHFRARPLKVVSNLTNLFSSGVSLDLRIASHRTQCFSTSSSPLPLNYGYHVIKPPMLPTIVDLTTPIKINPKGLGCDLPGDPNILPVFALTSCDLLTGCTETQLVNVGIGKRKISLSYEHVDRFQFC
jgi:hypothetical protein